MNLENNYIEVNVQFDSIFESAESFKYAPPRIQQMFLDKLKESMSLTYIDNTFGVRVGDVIEVPFGASTRIGIVNAVPSKQEIKDTIKYKEILSGNILD